MRVTHGFTLIELMIVVAIIAILAAIALPAYQDYTIRAQVSEGVAMTSGLKNAIAQHFADRGNWPPNNVSLGFVQTISGAYVSDISSAGGVITTTYGQNANALIAGQLLSMRPGVTANGEIAWVCGSRTPPTGLVMVGADASTLLQKYRSSACKA